MTEPSSLGPLTHGFLFADLRGYTAYAEARGDSAAADLLEHYRSLVREVVAQTGGAEVKTEGDSFYVVFPSASRAVTAGLAIVDAAVRATAAEPTQPIQVGVGIHAGEAEERAEGFVGTAVNLAARVCALAQPGEVLVTDMVRGLTRTSGRYRFTPRGKPRLKGIAEPVAVYRAEAAEPAGLGAPKPAVRALPLGGPIVTRRTALVAVGAVAVVAVIAAGLAILRPASTGGGPSTLASASLSLGSSVASALPTVGNFGGEMGPGKYCSTTFTPGLCLTLQDDWTMFVEIPNELGLGHFGGEQEALTFSRPTVFVQPCEIEKTTTIGRGAQDFIDWLKSNKGLTVGDPVPATLGTVDTIAFDVTIGDGCGSTWMKQKVFIDYQTFLGSTYEHGFSVLRGVPYRLYVAEIKGELIVITVAPETQAAMKDFLLAAQSALSSLEIAR